MAGTVTIKYSYGQVLANVEASEVTVGFLNGKNGEDATLPANLAYTDVENVFTKKQTIEGQQIPLQFRYVKSGETILSLFSSSIEALGNEAFTEIQLYRNGSFKNKLSIFETFISSTGKDLGTTLLRFKELFLSSYANVLGVKSVENDATKVFATDGSVITLPSVGESINTDFIVTVGVIGDYSTINEALVALSAMKVLYVSEGFSGEISLLTGFEMSEQVIVTNGIDFSWVKITSVDASVNIVRSSILKTTNNLVGFDVVGEYIGAFMAANGATLPRIACIFSMDASGAVIGSGQNGILLAKDSKCFIDNGFGFNDCTGLGAHVIYGSTLNASGSIWERNGSSLHAFYAGGVRGDWVSFLNLQEAVFQDNLGQGVMINGASVCSLRDALIDNSGADGLQTGGCSIVHARGLTSTNNTGKGIFASEGSSIRLLNSTISFNGGNGVLLEGASIVNSSLGTVINNNGGNGVKVTQGSVFSIITPTIQNNAIDGITVEASSAYISSGNISGNTGDDLSVASGLAIIRLAGTITTSSGSTSDNNVTDSNVASFNAFRRDGAGGIFGRGGKSSNRGNATILNGSTFIDVTHGVDFTIVDDEINILPQEAWGNSTQYWISNITSTQFRINVNVDPAKDLTFGWNIKRIFG